VLWEAISGACPFASEPDSIAARLSWRTELEPMLLGAPVLPVAAKLALERMLRPSLAYREADARLCARRLRAAVGRGVRRTTSVWALAAS
jgi:hypothetical protein